MDKQALIEKYRHINVDFGDWHEDIIANFKDKMAAIGFEVTNTRFSGFWSQGDGASFEGTICDPLKFFEHTGFDSGYPQLYRIIKAGGFFTLSIHSTGRYVHSNTMLTSDFEFDDWRTLTYPTDTDRVREAVVEKLQQLLYKEFRESSRIEDEFLEYMRDKADELYRELGAEYDFLTNDDEVWEAIIANELDEDEDENEETEEIIHIERVSQRPSAGGPLLSRQDGGEETQKYVRW